MEKLIETYKKILEKNPKILLSGSLALNIQGFKTKRNPMDIDIYLPHGEAFTLIDGMKRVPIREDYEDEDYIRSEFMLDNTKIDVFTPVDSNIPNLQERYNFPNKINMVVFYDIIKFKLKHSFTEYTGSYKHKQDITYFIVIN